MAVWTKAEDNALRKAVSKYGANNNWKQVAEDVPGRTNKACRKRWLHSLSPVIKKSAWTREEDNMLIDLYHIHGEKWAIIARFIKGRTDDACSKRYREALDPNLRTDDWSTQEDELLLRLEIQLERKWKDIGLILRRSGLACRNRVRCLERRRINPHLYEQDDRQGSQQPPLDVILTSPGASHLSSPSTQSSTMFNDPSNDYDLDYPIEDSPHTKNTIQISSHQVSSFSSLSAALMEPEHSSSVHDSSHSHPQVFDIESYVGQRGDSVGFLEPLPGHAGSITSFGATSQVSYDFLNSPIEGFSYPLDCISQSSLASSCQETDAMDVDHSAPQRRDSHASHVSPQSHHTPRIATSTFNSPASLSAHDLPFTTSELDWASSSGSEYPPPCHPPPGYSIPSPSSPISPHTIPSPLFSPSLPSQNPIHYSELYLSSATTSPLVSSGAVSPSYYDSPQVGPSSIPSDSRPSSTTSAPVSSSSTTYYYSGEHDNETLSHYRMSPKGKDSSTTDSRPISATSTSDSSSLAYYYYPPTKAPASHYRTSSKGKSSSTEKAHSSAPAEANAPTTSPPTKPKKKQGSRKTRMVPVTQDESILPYACGQKACWSYRQSKSKHCFRTAKELYHHNKIHENKGDDTEERPFRCGLVGCGRAWKSVNGLQYHFQVSTVHYRDALSKGFSAQEQSQDGFAAEPSASTETEAPLDNVDGRLRCPHPNCFKTYKHLSGLNYHKKHGHPRTDPHQLPTIPVKLAEKTQKMHLRPRQPPVEDAPAGDTACPQRRTVVRRKKHDGESVLKFSSAGAGAEGEDVNVVD